jgi:uncharacterized membrane protein HdeD (DUF308 family)
MEKPTYTTIHARSLKREGIAVAVLGLLAILLPRFFAFGISLLIGVILILAGGFKFQRSLSFRGWPGFGWLVGESILLTLAGVAFLLSPRTGIAVLSLILAVLFIVEGLAEIALSIQFRPLPAWPVVLVSGLASLAIAALLIASWPNRTAWLIGLLVGINFLFTGAWLLSLSSAVRRASGS